MFKPFYGICTGKGRYQGCGKPGMIMTNSRRQCQNCEGKKKQAELQEQIEVNNTYYRKMIGLNIVKNKGKCRCDECGAEIKNPVGRNCHHIVAGSRLKAVYLDPENSYILGTGIKGECDCGVKFDSGPHRQDLKIYADSEERRTRVKGKHYIKA